MTVGHFEVMAYPTVYSAKRITSLPEVLQVIRDCQVALRGWYFPHIQRDAATTFSDGFQSATSSPRHTEAFRLYQSGLFRWRGMFWEDGPDAPKSEDGSRGLSFISAIWSFTEFLLYLSRLYERIAPDTTVRIAIKMSGCRGRELRAYDVMVAFFGGYVSQEDVISQEREVQVSELRASYLAIAAEMVKHVFHVFNWMDPQDSMIASWQQKLIKRQFQ
jgi:hypothetical protein